MQYQLTSEAERRLDDFLERIGRILANKKRRASFACYAIGLLGDGERKSVEPIAARACPDPRSIDAAHQRLLHFLTDSAWSDLEVRREATRYALPMLTERDPIEAWILDDTGFLKQGSHSVGVQRQYTGSAGKIANCQIAVSLTVATRRDHLPIDFELYLPKAWLGDQERRNEARIPEDVVFKTKIELGLDLIRRAIDAKLPRGVVLADSFYGDAADFRATLRQLGLHYAVGVSYNLKVWRVDRFGKRRGAPVALEDIAKKIPRRAVRQVMWKEGTKTELSARFAVRRVVPCHADGTPAADREDIWLVIEWKDGEEKPHYYFSSLPRSTTKKRLIRTIKQRWRTERVYEDLKGELGLDHYEGRRFPGWQHHVSIVLCCYAFVAAERARSFSPSAGGTLESCPNLVAA
jgi:SRSO17 transposase